MHVSLLLETSCFNEGFSVVVFMAFAETGGGGKADLLRRKFFSFFFLGYRINSL